jgi:hypothetical protein
MSKAKMMLLTLLVAALAVPSLWAQKQKGPERHPSVDEIRQALQRGGDELERIGMPVVRSNATPAAICTAIGGGLAPAGYLAGTNKCTSSVPVYGLGDSLNTTVSACADKGGSEGTWGVGMTVGQAGATSSVFPSWGGPFNVGGTEFSSPVYYTPAISPSPNVVLTLKAKQAVFGLEVSNPTQQSYTVTFGTTAGTVGTIPTTINVGGVAEPDSQAQRFIAICNVAAIQSVTIQCNGCADAAATAVSQIRGDKFPGF